MSYKKLFFDSLKVVINISISYIILFGLVTFFYSFEYLDNTPQINYINISRNKTLLIEQYVINKTDKKLLYGIKEITFINTSGPIYKHAKMNVVGYFDDGPISNNIYVKTNVYNYEKNTAAWMIQIRHTFCHEILHNWIRLKVSVFNMKKENKSQHEHYIIDEKIGNGRICYI